MGQPHFLHFRLNVGNGIGNSEGHRPYSIYQRFLIKAQLIRHFLPVP